VNASSIVTTNPASACFGPVRGSMGSASSAPPLRGRRPARGDGACQRNHVRAGFMR
jgi:hypothetical protein